MDQVGRAITDWLTSAHPAPAQARAEWGDPRRGHVALIPTGHAFDTVRVTASIVHAAVGAKGEATVAAFLSSLVDGPVIHDAYATSVAYYFLVPVGSCTHHTADDAQHLASGTWIGVPEPARTARPGPFWVLAPRQRDDLCIPGYVDQLIRAGRRALAEPPAAVPGVDRIRQECHALVDPGGLADPTYEAAAILILRMRGYLQLLVAAVEEHAERRPPTDALGARARYLAHDAHLLLEEEPDACVIPRKLHFALRCARCVLGMVEFLWECDPQAATR